MTTTARQSEDRRGAATAEAAARLQGAAERGVPCAPFRDLIGTSDVALAYAVQQRRTQARLAGGARIVGHKIGLTSLAVQRQLKVDRPDFGVLFDDMDVSALAVGRTSGSCNPRSRRRSPSCSVKTSAAVPWTWPECGNRSNSL